MSYTLLNTDDSTLWGGEQVAKLQQAIDAPVNWDTAWQLSVSF